MRPGLARNGFGTRLLIAQGVVLAVTVVTAAAVAWLLGPSIFHDHLAQAGHTLDATGVDHVERAFADASYLSLGIALAVALLCAAGVSWWLAARVRGPLADLTTAAAAMAQGDYGTRVGPSGTAAELDALAASFNEMAERLEHVEDTRRRLLSDLAHELRTPIATLSGYLDGIDDGMVAWTEPTRLVLHDQVRRLRRLATDIDEVSRAEEGRITLQRTRIPVHQVIGAAVDAVRDGFARKGVTLTAPGPAAGESAATSCLVDVDPERMGQVFTNLLGNALRHTPPGGSVRVAAARREGTVIITVADTGEGITAEHLPHVFERLYRGDRARHRGDGVDHGAGIGLTISKAIVEAHGGTVRAASDGPGLGATLTITLPMATVAAPPPSIHPPSAHPPSAHAEETR